MLKIEKTVTASPAQWEIIIEGARNAMNSWDRMDSGFKLTSLTDHMGSWIDAELFTIGVNDHKLLSTLANGGPVHGKYRRMIPVWMTLTAPLYWYKEMDTYKVGTVCNSCSTMHKIHSKEFTMDDFSHGHLGKVERWILRYVIIKRLNHYRKKYLEAKTKPMKEVSKRAEVMKRHWWQMIQLLPSSYNQKRTYMLNYEVLHNIYHSRKNHKLDEWHTFCDWIETLPYSELITMEEKHDK